MPPRKRIIQAAPTAGYTGDLGDALAAMSRAGSKGPSAPRRTRSLNPSRVGINKSLQIRRRVPTATDLLDSTHTEAGVGESTRVPGVQLPQPGSLPGLGEQLGLFDVDPDESGVDRTEIISPPNSTEPGRPRALEARYDPDNKRLVVRFRNGGTYAYDGVPTATWRALKRNKSFGKTMDRLVLNQYPYEKINF